jgi:hypothetical protein
MALHIHRCIQGNLNNKILLFLNKYNLTFLCLVRIIFSNSKEFEKKCNLMA